MQGYLVSRPLPGEELTQFLAHYQPLPFPVEDQAARTLLLVDDEPSLLSALVRSLRRENYHLLTAGSGEAGLALLAENEVGVILCDQRMQGMNGTDFLTRTRIMHPRAVRMILSGYTDLESLTEAINRGEIYRFLTKPWEDAELREAIRDAFRHYENSQKNRVQNAPG